VELSQQTVVPEVADPKWDALASTSFLKLDLLVPRSRTALAQSRSFASIGPTLWNALSPSVRSTFLSGSLSSSYAFLKTYFFSWGLAHWQRF